AKSPGSAAASGGARCYVPVSILLLCDACVNPKFKFRVSNLKFGQTPRSKAGGLTRNSKLRNARLEVIRVVLVAQAEVRADRSRRLRSRHCIAVLVDLHAETQTHRLQNLLDLVQRLAAEILGLQHFGFGLLHELANSLDIRILQAVVAAHRELEFLD